VVFQGKFEAGVTSDNLQRILAFFALGALSGYGSRTVMKWLDAHVDRIFKVSTEVELEVPALGGHTKNEAQEIVPPENSIRTEISDSRV
jgi:NhaP-type Na+/H+ or K+/H+ antiporter